MSFDVPEQITRYRALRARGTTMATACVLAGISMGDARLIEADDLAKQSPAAGQPQQPKEEPMGRASAKRAAEAVQEVVKPDFERAVKLYRQDIKPARSKQGEYGQQQTVAYKEIRDACHVQPAAAKQAFHLNEMEESKRDDWLRSFNGLLKQLGIFMPLDLVDAAEGAGKVGEAVVPVGERRRPQLATVPVSDGVDADLAGDDEPHAEAAE